MVIMLVMVQFSQAQTADDVIDKYIAALGGKEKLLSLTSVRMTGSFNVQGTDVGVVISRKQGVGSRADFSVMGTENYQLVTPTKGSVFMPVQGQSAPEDMADDQVKAGQIQLDIQSPFLNYKEKGNTVEFAGKETTDGVECYKLKVTFKNGAKMDYYIDTKDSRIFKTSTKINVNGEDVDAATTYGNYKQNADGYWFPYTTNSSRGETTYEKIETNIALDENLFKIN